MPHFLTEYPHEWEPRVANAVHRAHAQGRAELAGLLLQVTSFETTLREDFDGIAVRLTVPMELLERCSDPRVLADFGALLQPDYDVLNIADVSVRGEADSSTGWRDRAFNQLAERPDNQAALAPLPSSYPSQDRIKFRSDAELRVYRALKRIQEKAAKASSGDSLTIIPLPACRVPGRSWEPDFIVIFRGRALAIEVDGPHHAGQRAKDIGRDNVLRGAGLGDVRRIDVRDTSDDAHLDEELSVMLRQLVRN
jgi:hypothetical protein